MSHVKTLPASLKVKNTFIDVRPDFVTDEGTTSDSLFDFSSFSKRQSSEPAPELQTRSFSLRQTSDTLNPMSMLAASSLLEEEDEEESRAEKEADDNFGESSGLGRQVTEMHWPTWDSAAGVEKAYVPEAFDPANAWAASPYMMGAGGLGGQLSSAEADSLASWQAPLDPSDMSMMNPFAQGAAKNVPAEWREKTTVMIRNLPNKYNQQLLLEELNSSGFLGTFDFLYLPIDPETNANRGYGFINFTDPSFAYMLKTTYEGRKMGRFNSEKVVSVAPAALQGFEANYAHYSTARVNRGDPSSRPLFLRESRMSQAKNADGRRRGGRRSQGSLIDMAARQQAKSQAPGNAMVAGYIGLSGPSPPGAVEGKGEKRASDGGKSQGPASSSSSEANMQPKFCPYCGGKAQPEFRFCQFCGASLAILSGKGGL